MTFICLSSKRDLGKPHYTPSCGGHQHNSQSRCSSFSGCMGLLPARPGGAPATPSARGFGPVQDGVMVFRLGPLKRPLVCSVPVRASWRDCGLGRGYKSAIPNPQLHEKRLKASLQTAGEPRPNSLERVAPLAAARESGRCIRPGICRGKSYKVLPWHALRSTVLLSIDQ
jgi:hypothetical protein